MFGNEEGDLNAAKVGNFKGVVGYLSDTGNVVAEKIAERYSVFRSVLTVPVLDYHLRL
ncbi:excinuclease ABC, A subunit domain protein [Anaplasma phagocytophilum str. ApWI1]|uniref:Excinuclease ABC, A subunit domain protein n=1 Tax=Anaplasma phagocytophilum str. ApWI1 TaxID=1359155 RepID=A0A0F3Q1L2_ANAPH|nr:hypothetical protein [Anaplasma phagocytophilum]KJV85349.1 excinuclease ABC, A subunit domain protein [Anaplasma phagocytophilum str. ApWI1]